MILRMMVVLLSTRHFEATACKRTAVALLDTSVEESHGLLTFNGGFHDFDLRSSGSFIELHNAPLRLSGESEMMSLWQSTKSTHACAHVAVQTER